MNDNIAPFGEGREDEKVINADPDNQLHASSMGDWLETSQHQEEAQLVEGCEWTVTEGGWRLEC